MNKRWLISVSVAAAAISLACTAIPLFVIQPGKAQGARGLAIALAVQQVGPMVSLLCAALGIVLVGLLWKRSRLVPLTMAILAVAGAGVSRVNIYEKMFHPIGNARFESAAEAKVEGDDMVMAVALKRERRAYPVREMAYHHVVNDVLAGEPIAATY